MQIIFATREDKLVARRSKCHMSFLTAR